MVELTDLEWQRLFEKILPTGFCWEWTAYRNKGGYGVVRYRGKTVLAHRLMYEALVGPIPDGKVLDHLCRIRHCVNPDHVEPTTRRINAQRGYIGWWVRERRLQITSCPRGHPYDGDNLIMDNGSRRCRRCKINGQRRRAGWSEEKIKEWDGRNAKIKLTEDQVLLIKESSLSNAKLSKFLGISKGAVQEVRAGRNWKHVQPERGP